MFGVCFVRRCSTSISWLSSRGEFEVTDWYWRRIACLAACVDNMDSLTCTAGTTLDRMYGSDHSNTLQFMVGIPFVSDGNNRQNVEHLY